MDLQVGGFDLADRGALAAFACRVIIRSRFCSDSCKAVSGVLSSWEAMNIKSSRKRTAARRSSMTVPRIMTLTTMMPRKTCSDNRRELWTLPINGPKLADVPTMAMVAVSRVMLAAPRWP